jgi:hypothetical protein
VDQSTEPNTPAGEPENENAPVTETAEQLAELTDEQVEAVIAEASDAAQAAVDAETFVEPVFEAALARATAAKAELSARTEKASRLATAKAKAAELAATRPAPAAVPSVATITKTVPVVPSSGTPLFRLEVPTDAHNLISGREQGSEYRNFSEIGQAFAKRMESYSSVKGTSVSHNLAVIRREWGPELTVTRDDNDDTIIRDVRNERRLSGGNLAQSWAQNVTKLSAQSNSLTAAAGWCAPSETLYDLCELETMDGIAEFPTVTASRGGLRWTQDPSYPDLDAALNYSHLTEAQVIANTAKVCAPIPCPTFTDTRLDVSATCVTGSFLQLRGYPELVARYVRGALTVHAHKENRDRIAALVTRAGAVTPIVAPVEDSIIAALLSGVEAAAEDIRYRYRMSFNATMEVILPHFVLPLMRADFTRRSQGDVGLTNAAIANWFAVRNIRPQFVYDWQDGYSGAGATSPGGDATAPFPLTLVPASGSVEFLIYPAGSVVLATQDVITLRSVYDSTNLAQNLYTELFTEDGWALIYPCPGLRRYSVLACPGGTVGFRADLGCVA